MRRLGIAILLVLLVLVMGHPVWAHASLLRSVPPANAVLDQAPARIQLWFTERLEPSESSIDVLDSTGKKINTAPTVIDPTDPTSMSVEPGPMRDGVYTISWHNVSQDDGHPLLGSFAITIGPGAATAVTPGVTGSEVNTPPATGQVLSQWFLFLFASLVLGGAGFTLFIWQPASLAAPLADSARVELWLYRAVWIGYTSLGVAVSFSLLVQAAQISPGGTVDIAGLSRLFKTRFGLIWLVRLALWIGMGVSLAWSTRTRRAVAGWISLILGCFLLLTISLLSHGEAAQLTLPALAEDWLHLTASSLWVGGLIAFAVVLAALRANPEAVPLRAALTQYFSNMARVAVAALLLTGVYAAWLEIGSLDALTHTRYGQTLLLKLGLIVPLLLIAAVNLLLTQRRLNEAAQRRSPTRWSGLLRGLVGGEVVLTALVLLVAGTLSSSVPARSVSEVQAANASAAQAATPSSYMLMTSAMHVILGITPDYAGSNTFSVGLFSLATGQPINDAILVKLQFNARDAAIGSSQLNAKPQGKGSYTVTGANLSLPGTWRVRVSIQRPNAYDEVVNFNLQVPPAPAIPERGPLPFQSSVLVVLGAVGAAGRGFFASTSRQRWRSGGGLLALGILGCSVLFVGAGLLTLASEQNQVAASAAAAANLAADLAVLELLSRWLSMGALAILGGGFVFTPLILQPALAEAARHTEHKELLPGGSFSAQSGLFRMLAVSCGTAVIATLAEITFGAANQAIVLVWFRLPILAGVGALLAFRRSRWWRRDSAQRWWWVGSVLSGLVLLIVSLNGPPTVTIDPLLAAAIDWIQLIALSTWLGGLVALVLTMRWLCQANVQRPVLAPLTARFFQVAVLCIVVTGITGVYRGFDEIGAPANLVGTPYGLTLLVKLGLLVLLLGLSVWSLATLSRSLVQGPAWYRWTLRRAGLEAGLGVLIVLAASLLGSLPLPRLSAQAGQPVTGAAVSLATQEDNTPNPVSPDAVSVVAGHTLFLKNCVSCHGVSGHGDGPVGRTLNPRPADLTVHAVPGVHTDGQLFQWISNGYPNSAMPAWAKYLSETDRWNLVNYIRTLAPNHP